MCHALLKVLLEAPFAKSEGRAHSLPVHAPGHLPAPVPLSPQRLPLENTALHSGPLTLTVTLVLGHLLGEFCLWLCITLKELHLLTVDTYTIQHSVALTFVLN